MQLSDHDVSRLRSAITDGVSTGMRKGFDEDIRLSVFWRQKFDALIAAVFETLGDATRDRILARAKELEAEADGHDDD